MPSAPYWDDAPEAWDQITIAGTTLPGQAIISGDGIGRKIDVKSGPGRDGAKIRDRGYEPARFDIECITWTKEQFNELLPIVEQLQPKRRGGNRDPVDVSHPSLSILGIRSMYIEKVGMPISKSGRFHVPIKAIEWVTQPRSRPGLDEAAFVVTIANVQTQLAVNIARPGGNTAFTNYEAARQRPSTDP
jgi:hypothetical protein